MIDAKIVQKNFKKGIASAGDADPGQGGFWEDNPRQAEVQHAVAHPPDGRADCLRFAHPAEATGDWRLGDLEALLRSALLTCGGLQINNSTA